MMRNFKKTSLKLTAWRSYVFAEKIHGYEVRITGDIDQPEQLLNDAGKRLLEEWVLLALEIGTLPPILFTTITAPNLYLEMKQYVESIDAKAMVAAHGYQHVHYPKHGNIDEIIRCREFSDWFRFPFLDFNMRLLKTVSQHFNYDSSVTSTKMYPYKIGEMIEYPITPPTDTYYRDKGFDTRVVEVYSQRIETSKSAERSAIFLLHPNSWSLSLMKELAKR
jgi:peptidoglycan/xylan/chitin deacetylase (PgdA/CDA1 family)